MPSPPNDNFDNATILNGDTGTLIANNTGATAEPGEPHAQGHSVWFQWTPQAISGYGFIDTRPLANNIPAPLLRSQIHIYRQAGPGQPGFPLGSSGNLFNEVTYYFGPNSQGLNQQYGGVSLGAYLIVEAALGHALYIQIDCATNSSAADNQGSFLLSWGPSNGPPKLGGCNTCYGDIGLKTQCVASLLMPFNPFETPQVGDVIGGVAFGVSRQRFIMPAGTYMMRYCGGYYRREIPLGGGVVGVYAFTNTGRAFPPGDPGSSHSLLFHSGVADGMFLRVSDVANPGTPISPNSNPGAISMDFTGLPVGGTPPFSVAAISAFWWDGSQWQGNDQNINSGHDDGPAAPSISGVLNPVQQFLGNGGITGPPFPTYFPLGIANGADGPIVPAPPNSPFLKTPPFIEQEFGCEETIFHHAGGAMNWFSAVSFGGAGYLDGDCNEHQLADGLGVDLSLLFTVFSDGPCAPTGPSSEIFIGSAAPSYSLMRILPDISLVSALNFIEDTITANGPKTASFQLALKNNSIITWPSVTFTPNGFFTAQDPNYYPTPPLTEDFPQGELDMSFEYNITNPVGTVTITLSDADGNPYQSFPINVTPLFKLNSLALGNEFQLNGQNYRGINIALSNIGNGTTLAAQLVITATANGQPVQIGLDESPAPGPLGPSVTVPLSLGPNIPQGGNSTVVAIYVAATAQPQNLTVNLSITDTGNTFPPMQSTINIPAA